MTKEKADPVREQLFDELSDVLRKILDHGGPGALAASAAAAVMVAAIAAPTSLLVDFIESLVAAIRAGTKLAGHEVMIVGGVAEIETPTTSVH